MAIIASGGLQWNPLADYARLTGIGSLKVKHNNVLGYFVEVTATHGEAMLARDEDTAQITGFGRIRARAPS